MRTPDCKTKITCQLTYAFSFSLAACRNWIDASYRHREVGSARHSCADRKPQPGHKPASHHPRIGRVGGRLDMQQDSSRESFFTFLSPISPSLIPTIHLSLLCYSEPLPLCLSNVFFSLPMLIKISSVQARSTSALTSQYILHQILTKNVSFVCIFLVPLALW